MCDSLAVCVYIHAQMWDGGDVVRDSHRLSRDVPDRLTYMYIILFTCATCHGYQASCLGLSVLDEH